MAGLEPITLALLGWKGLIAANTLLITEIKIFV
jgi:hypothetical protein